MGNALKPEDRLSFFWTRQLHAQRPASEPRGALTIPHAARYLGCSVKHVRKLIWSRQIKYVQAGRRFIIPVTELDRYLAESARHA